MHIANQVLVRKKMEEANSEPTTESGGGGGAPTSVVDGAFPSKIKQASPVPERAEMNGTADESAASKSADEPGK